MSDDKPKLTFMGATFVPPTEDNWDNFVSNPPGITSASVTLEMKLKSDPSFEPRAVWFKPLTEEYDGEKISGDARVINPTPEDEPPEGYFVGWMVDEGDGNFSITPITPPPA